MEYKTLTVEQLKEHCPNLGRTTPGHRRHEQAGDGTENRQGIVGNSQQGTGSGQGEGSRAGQAAAIVEELKAARIDTADKVAYSESFIETLKAAPDAAARKRLIEDRTGLLKRAVSQVAMAAPLGAISGLTEGENVGPVAQRAERPLAGFF